MFWDPPWGVLGFLRSPQGGLWVVLWVLSLSVEQYGHL